MKKFTEEDKNKIMQLIDKLKAESNDDNEMDFLCTHCHCKICSTMRSGSEKKYGGE
ncbi:MAG: hypothetical protein FWD05_08785 [Oscillospiraceae bacterium]|nr:hypothetical protein [Oscillospiraceae bacterium]